MADNPIKYSDFIKPDGSITDLIEQLVAVQTTYSKMRDDVLAAAKELEAALKKVNNTNIEGQETTKAAVAQSDQLAKAQEKLALAQTENGKKLIDLRQQQSLHNNVTKLTKKLNDAAEGSYNKLSAQYSLNKIRLNAMSEAQRKGTKEGREFEKQTRLIYEEMNRLQKATGKSQLQVGAYEKGWKNAAGQMQMMPGIMGRMGSSIGRLGMALKTLLLNPIVLGVAALVAMGAAMIAVVRNSMEFSATMSKVRAVTGATSDEMKDLKDNAKELGSTTLKTATEVAQLQFELAKLGFIVPDIINMTSAITKLSIAAGSEMGRTAEVLGTTMRSMGLAADKSDHVADVMAKSFSTSALDLEKFAESYKYVGPIAKVTNTSLEETTAMLAVLANAGISGSNSGTALRMIMLKLGEQSGTLTEKIMALKDEGLGLADANDEVGQRAMTALLVLADQAKMLPGLQEGFENANGSVDEMARIMSDNLTGDIEILKSTWNGAMLAIEDGEGILAKASRFMIQDLTQFITEMKNGSEAISQFFSDLWRDLQYVAFRFEKEVYRIGEIFGQLGSWVSKGLKGDFSGIKDDFNNITAETERLYGDQVFLSKRALEQKKKDDERALRDKMRSLGAETDAYAEEENKRTRESEKARAAREKAEAAEFKRRELAVKYAKEKSKLFNDIEDFKTASVIRNNDLILGSDKYTFEQQEQAAKDNFKLRTESTLASTQIELDELENKKKLRLISDQDYSNQKLLIESKLADDLSKLDEGRARAEEKIIDSRIAAAERLKVESEKETQLLDKQAKDRIRMELEKIEQETDLRMSEIDLLKTTEAEKTRLRLEAEKDRFNKILAMNKLLGGELSDLQIKEIQNHIKKIDQEMTRSKTDNMDFYSMVGLKVDDKQKEAIATSTQFAIDNVRSFLQAQVDAANKAVEASGKEVDAKKSALDAEIEARRNGYASNVELARKEFDQAKTQQQKALKEQEKAQKAQAAIDSLAQVSNLVTATAGIWKSFASTGPWGIAAAVAATALMWGSFAASKLKASQLTKKEYGDGGLEFLSGGSHASGNDIGIGITSDGRDRRAEGGEALAIINKGNTRKYRKILPGVVDALNKGVFEKKYGQSYNTGGLAISVPSAQVNLKSLESDVREIRSQGERKYFVDSRGRTIETYKNLKIIHNAN